MILTNDIYQVLHLFISPFEYRNLNSFAFHSFVQLGESFNQNYHFISETIDITLLKPKRFMVRDQSPEWGTFIFVTECESTVPHHVQTVGIPANMNATIVSINLAWNWNKR